MSLNRKPLLRLICFLTGLLSTLVFAFVQPTPGIATPANQAAAPQTFSSVDRADWYAVNSSHREPNFYQ